MSDASPLIDEREAEFGDYFALLKPRVMSLVVFTAAVGLFVAPVPVHPVIAFASILFIAIGAGASGALNMWWDADIDAVMTRTQSRPVPSGRITGAAAKQLGIWLSVIAVVMLWLTANALAGALLAFTIFFYAVVYSMWLKRSTPQNIVIGGAAGAFPPMIGWAVATGNISVDSVLMFGLIFVWTPPHFWALALFMNDDYTKAGVPMLPVTHGTTVTRKQIMIYALLLAPVALGISFTSIGGPVYFAISLVLNAAFLRGAWHVLHRSDAAAFADKFSVERKFFRLSLYFLFLHFGGLLIEAALRATSLDMASWPQWV
ncbi:MAG: protoheme IX farnesyltransferase [Alphaproteobacteria bacterium]|nr:protoheme IX farnesyltransferase [Alphaproteobacteria bacterium]